MSKGGKRWGAGRPGWHVKAEDCQSIDVRRWHRDGLLYAGCVGEWVWRTSHGRRVASAAFSVMAESMSLDYASGSKSPDPSGNVATQYVPLLRTPCQFGGQRTWFACPHCGRRVAVLYQRPATGFACRRCAQVAYASQSEDVMARAWRKQGKLERLLGVGMIRPTGMHHTTHGHLLSRVARCEEQRLAALVAWLPSGKRDL